MKKYLGILIVFGLLVLCTPLAKADTLEDLIKQVQSLTTQVASLKTQLSGQALGSIPGPTNTTGPTSFSDGCTSNSGYSSTTNIGCAGGPNLVSFYPGLINEHVLTTPGAGPYYGNVWVSDTAKTGSTSANVADDTFKLNYCKKFYPNTISVVPFGNQTLVDWKNVLGATSTSTRMAYQCVQGTTPTLGCTSTSTPSITVTSPKGGEIYTAGGMLNIKWNSCNTTNKKVSIELRKKNHPIAGGLYQEYSWANIAENIPDAGSFSWPINLSSLTPIGIGQITPGNDFYVNVTDSVNFDGVYDFSNNPFTINPQLSDCQTLYWTDNNNQTCASVKSFCGSYMYQGLKTFKTQSECKASVLTPTTPSTPSAPAVFCSSSSIIGDVNGDGKINPIDALLVNRMYINLVTKPDNICCVDTDGNGTINSNDSQLINNYYIKAKPTGLVGQMCPKSISGNIYVVDKGNNRIQKFTSDGTFITKWGSNGSSDGQFKVPHGIAIDSSGNVYVTDFMNDRIEKFNSSGFFITKWKPGNLDNSVSLYGIAIDSTGNVYVVDAYHNNIKKYNSNGVYLTQWGNTGSGNGQFFNILYIALDSSGNVYVTDNGNSRIQKFTSDGTFITKWGTSGNGDGQFNFLSGIAVDSSGNVYVADNSNNRIQKFTSDGTFITKWEEQIKGNPGNPTGIVTDSSDNVYVAVSDSYNNSYIQKFTSNGILITQWGGKVGVGDGYFDGPLGIAISK